jgi:hypothetical protein
VLLISKSHTLCSKDTSTAQFVHRQSEQRQRHDGRTYKPAVPKVSTAIRRESEVQDAGVAQPEARLLRNAGAGLRIVDEGLLMRTNRRWCKELSEAIRFSGSRRAGKRMGYLWEDCRCARDGDSAECTRAWRWERGSVLHVSAAVSGSPGPVVDCLL